MNDYATILWFRSLYADILLDIVSSEFDKVYGSFRLIQMASLYTGLPCQAMDVDCPNYFLERMENTQLPVLTDNIGYNELVIIIFTVSSGLGMRLYSYYIHVQAFMQQSHWVGLLY